jgi:hypothetical protein
MSSLAESLPALVAATSGGADTQITKQPKQRPKNPLAQQVQQAKARAAQAAQAAPAANGKTPLTTFTPLNQEQMKKGAPPIHPNFKRFAIEIKKAFDEEKDGVLMEMFLRGLMFLRKTHPKWQKGVETLLQHMKDDDKVKAAKYIEVFLHTFVDADLIEPEVAEAIDECFSQHWAQARETLGFKTPDAEPSEPAEDVAEVVSAESKVAAAGGPDEPNVDGLDDDNVVEAGNVEREAAGGGEGPGDEDDERDTDEPLPVFEDDDDDDDSVDPSDIE